MITPNRIKSTFAGLLASSSVLGFAAVLPNSARAVTIISAPEALQTMTPSNTNFYAEVSASEGGGFGSNPVNSSEVDLGLFTFSDYADITSLVGLQINLELNQLNTQLPTVRSPNGGTYYNDIDLTINGIDTGIALNGFGGGSLPPVTITGIVNSTAATAILAEFNGTAATQYNYILPESQVVDGVTQYTNVGGVLSPNVVSSGQTYASGGGDLAENNFAPVFQSGTTSAGELVVGLVLVNQDTNPAIAGSPLEFQEVGGSASLEVANNPIPFEPSQALGFGLIALFIGLWYVPATKEMMKRMLVPANA